MPHAAVIFDVDGVLLDMTGPEEDAFFHPFEALHGLTGLSRDWNSYRIRNDEDIIVQILEEHLERQPTGHEISAVCDLYLAHLESLDLPVVEILGAGEALAELRQGGIGVGIATANLIGAAKYRLAKAGLWDHVEPLAFGADGGGAKRQVLARAIEASGLPRQRIVFLGDNLNDVEAGLGNGVHFIGFSEDSTRRSQLKQAGAEMTCATHREALSAIRRCLSPAEAIG